MNKCILKKYMLLMMIACFIICGKKVLAEPKFMVWKMFNTECKEPKQEQNGLSGYILAYKDDLYELTRLYVMVEEDCAREYVENRISKALKKLEDLMFRFNNVKQRQRQQFST